MQAKQERDMAMQPQSFDRDHAQAAVSNPCPHEVTRRYKTLIQSLTTTVHNAVGALHDARRATDQQHAYVG